MDETILNDTVTDSELIKSEKIYHEQLNKEVLTHSAQFDYAYCLVRSRWTKDIRKGIMLLEELFVKNPEGKRDYLYYLIIGNARVKEYTLAMKYCREFLNIEPGNQQVIALKMIINKKMEKEGLIGVAVAGGIVLAIGGLVGLGMALSKK